MDNVHESTIVDEPNADQLRRIQEIEAEAAGSEPSIAKKDEEPKEPSEAEEETEPTEEKPVERNIEVIEDDEQEIPKETREEKFVRLERHLKLRDKVKELTEENARLKSTSQDQISKEDSISAIRTLAEEQGIAPEAIEKLVKIAEEGAYSRIKTELGDRFNTLDQIKQKTEQQEKELLQEKIWSKQMSELVQKFPKEKEHIQSIEAKLKTLAYTREFSAAPLEVIYQGVNGLRPAKNKTIESGKGGSNRGETIDFARINQEKDDEAIAQMDQKTFSKFREYIKNNT